jgi:hypothetical protein
MNRLTVPRICFVEHQKSPTFSLLLLFMWQQFHGCKSKVGAGLNNSVASHHSFDCSNMDAHVVLYTQWDLEVLTFEILLNCVLPSLVALAAVDSYSWKLVLTYLQHRVNNIVSPFIEGIGEQLSYNIQAETQLRIVSLPSFFSALRANGAVVNTSAALAVILPEVDIKLVSRKS